jgi:hypothetical protein
MTPWDRLGLLKRAMYTVAQRFKSEGYNPPCTTDREKLLVAVACLRYARKGLWLKVTKCAAALSELSRYMRYSPENCCTSLRNEAGLRVYISQLALHEADVRAREVVHLKELLTMPTRVWRASLRASNPAAPTTCLAYRLLTGLF